MPLLASIPPHFALLASALCSWWLGALNLAHKWATERARAEAKRLAYFKAVINEVSDATFDQLLAFEYTRRFLLDNQIDYFRERGRQHERAHDSAFKMSTQAMFIASIITAVAGLLSIKRPEFATVAVFGLIASAYSTLVRSRSSVNLDRKNADRYRIAKDYLDERKLDINIYRHKVASGDKGAVQEFFQPIFVTLAADHKEFLDIAEQIDMAIGASEERLKEAMKTLK